jgi:hypothetical protein
MRYFLSVQEEYIPKASSTVDAGVDVMWNGILRPTSLQEVFIWKTVVGASGRNVPERQHKS